MFPRLPDTIEDEEKRRRAMEALSKFNFFLHLTMWLSGSAYLLILGILIPRWLIYSLIPIIIWTLGLAYHAYRVFIRKPRKRVYFWQQGRGEEKSDEAHSPRSPIKESSLREP